MTAIPAAAVAPKIGPRNVATTLVPPCQSDPPIATAVIATVAATATRVERTWKHRKYSGNATHTKLTLSAARPSQPSTSTPNQNGPYQSTPVADADRRANQTPSRYQPSTTAESSTVGTGRVSSMRHRTAPTPSSTTNSVCAPSDMTRRTGAGPLSGWRSECCIASTLTPPQHPDRP